MIKRKLKLSPPEYSRTVPTEFKIGEFSSARFTDELKEFLDKYYYGAYRLDNTAQRGKFFTVSLVGVCYFLKTVFEAVFAREMICVDVNLDYNFYEIVLNFDTGLIDDDTRATLSEISSKSRFLTEMSSVFVKIKIPLNVTSALKLYAGAEKRIYNTLSYIFFGI